MQGPWTIDSQAKQTQGNTATVPAVAIDDASGNGFHNSLKSKQTFTNMQRHLTWKIQLEMFVQKPHQIEVLLKGEEHLVQLQSRLKVTQSFINVNVEDIIIIEICAGSASIDKGGTYYGIQRCSS